MIKLLKYAFLIFTLLYLIKRCENYSYADLLLREIDLAQDLFGKEAYVCTNKIISIFSSTQKELFLYNQKLAEICSLALLRLALPVMLCLKSYCLFILFASFCLFHRHKAAYQKQINMHFQKLLNKYLLFISFYLLLFLLFSACTETLIYISCLLPALIVLLIKACFLNSGFPPYL